MKYFLMGAFATGFLLYGIALIYGATGSTNLNEISAYLIESPEDLPPYLIGGALLLLVGFAFKVGAVPFHFWVPDVYEGAPTPVTGFMSVAVKAAAFAAWARILMHQLAPLDSDWAFPLWVLAIITMTLGNLLAISQSSVKRMLAYSSIAHAGYLLIGLAVGNPLGISAILFYFVAYAFMNLGAFAMIVLINKTEKRTETLEDFKGLARQHPGWAFCFLIFLLSLAGIPPSAGFIGKFYLFAGAIQTGLYGLAVIAVLNSVLAFAYYFRIVRNMYMVEGRSLLLSPSLALRFSLVLLSLGTLFAGLYPAPFLKAAQYASRFIL
jgi:NADH-quinone oxidoreductase subunit N